jgi:hypothetical protein
MAEFQPKLSWAVKPVPGLSRTGDRVACSTVVLQCSAAAMVASGIESGGPGRSGEASGRSSARAAPAKLSTKPRTRRQPIAFRGVTAGTPRWGPTRPVRLSCSAGFGVRECCSCRSPRRSRCVPRHCVDGINTRRERSLFLCPGRRSQGARSTETSSRASTSTTGAAYQVVARLAAAPDPAAVTVTEGTQGVEGNPRPSKPLGRCHAEACANLR